MKNKIFIFIGGLLAGVVLGVLFSVAIKALIVQFREVHLSLNKINLKQSQLSQRLDSIQGKLVPDTKKTANPPVQNNTKAITSGNTKIQATQGNPKPPSASNQTASGAIPMDTDVVVMTNQLLSVMSVPLRDKDTSRENKKNEKTDSALASMSDINVTREANNWRVEFWKSPLNYKGYKMSRGKIILYGINPVTPVSITLQQDSYYLLVNQSAYKVEYTDDYKPFEKVTDREILKKVGL